MRGKDERRNTGNGVRRTTLVISIMVWVVVASIAVRSGKT